MFSTDILCLFVCVCVDLGIAPKHPATLSHILPTKTRVGGGGRKLPSLKEMKPD